MVSLKLTSLLTLALSALGVSATLGSSMTFTAIDSTVSTAPFAGGYWFQEIDTSTATSMTDADVQSAAKTGYTTAKAAASKVKTTDYPSGVKGPPIVVALWVPGKGTIIATSIKAGTAAQSIQTCSTITWKHRNYANCAEPNSVSIATAEGWTVAAGSKMAIYGKPGKTEGFQNPCADGTEKGDGCQKFLTLNPNIELVNPTTSSKRTPGEEEWLAQEFTA